MHVNQLELAISFCNIETLRFSYKILHIESRSQPLLMLENSEYLIQYKIESK